MPRVARNEWKIKINAGTGAQDSVVRTVSLPQQRIACFSPFLPPPRYALCSLSVLSSFSHSDQSLVAKYESIGGRTNVV
ncbi:hypothetical protein NDU88_006349 [Pleurodeles waltl]|uniref:Uncharacterized protein n=1 Tax=Pleurodeles waltl TaxID=8319 RepID=A0AAV7WE04_PLEWA|nr:hypothetical protein NDU88_006349 [Pleurodeles waltl]